jgi:hypothetical protein
VGDPAVDAASRIRAQLAALGPVVAAEEVGRDSVQPGEGGSRSAVARSTRERDSERLCSELVGEIAPGTSMEITMNGCEMPIEDRLERLGLAQRARQAIRIRTR